MRESFRDCGVNRDFSKKFTRHEQSEWRIEFVHDGPVAESYVAIGVQLGSSKMGFPWI
jgi:hypothetical protein